MRDGSTLRVRLLLPEGDHQLVNIALAGVRAARASTKQGEPSEPWGEEVGRITDMSCSITTSLMIIVGQIFH